SKLLNINEIAKRIGNFFKLPIQLFSGHSYPELALLGKFRHSFTNGNKYFWRLGLDCRLFIVKFAY
ncbi:MAG: hypothetical protein UHP27_06125, partial [Muribaculaceae bacterium]|nr:hypothetical protein [Muribaculaceae bacterium]